MGVCKSCFDAPTIIRLNNFIRIDSRCDISKQYKTIKIKLQKMPQGLRDSENGSVDIDPNMDLLEEEFKQSSSLTEIHSNLNCNEIIVYWNQTKGVLSWDWKIKEILEAEFFTKIIKDLEQSSRKVTHYIKFASLQGTDLHLTQLYQILMEVLIDLDGRVKLSNPKSRVSIVFQEWTTLDENKQRKLIAQLYRKYSV